MIDPARTHAAPLQGVRVLDLTRLLPGAYATLLLADLGADVIKIEDPRGGDPMRHVAALGGTSAYFERLHRGKRSITLDLRSADAADVLDALLARADVVVDSFRPSTARRLRVDHETLRARHPRLVCASISGFGQTGPYAERAAHDINYQALAGLLRPPFAGGPLIGDIGASYQSAVGILAAILHRDRTGQGSFVDVSIHDAARAWAMFPAADDFASACYAVYETADGKWLALGALEEKFWRGFCDRIGRPDLGPLQHAVGAEHARVLDEVRAIMRTRTRDEWLRLFADADVCLTGVYDAGDVAADPHVAARLLDRRRTPLGPAPSLGAHTDEVLASAGISAERRAALRAAGVI